MLSLLLDTATERGLVAICKGNLVLNEIQLPFGLQNSKSLFTELNRLLQECNVEKQSLQLIVCGQGPGSYTGMRVASAAAQSLSFALQIPLVGVPTTSGFVSDQEGEFAAIIDAKISGVYLQKGIRKNGEVQFKSEPEIVALENVHDRLQETRILVTPKKELLCQKLAGDYLWQESGLCPKTIIHQALVKLSQKRKGLELLYLRKTQAELEKLSLQSRT